MERLKLWDDVPTTDESVSLHTRLSQMFMNFSVQQKWTSFHFVLFQSTASSSQHGALSVSRLSFHFRSLSFYNKDWVLYPYFFIISALYPAAVLIFIFSAFSLQSLISFWCRTTGPTAAYTNWNRLRYTYRNVIDCIFGLKFFEINGSFDFKCPLWRLNRGGIHSIAVSPQEYTELVEAICWSLT